MIRLTCLIIFTTTLKCFSAADEISWTGWLGPKRDGFVSHFNTPSKWPKKLKKEWETNVGDGYGTAIVSKKRIYVHSRINNDEVIWCLDLNTGKPIWQNRYEVPFEMGGGGEPHGKGPKSNPTLANNKIFTLSITGILSAWSSDTGRLIWKKDHRSKFGKRPHPYWGATTSPLVVNNRVYLHFGNDEKGFLSSMDINTGKEIWRNGKDGAAYSSPLFAKINGIEQIIEWNHEDLQGVNIVTGKTLWKFHLPHRGTNQNMPTPSFHDGYIIVGGEKRGIRKIHPYLKNNKWHVTEKWHQKRAALNMSTAVINNNHLYGLSHYGLGELFCIDINNGEIVWRGSGRSGDNATFLSTPNHILSLLSNGNLNIIKSEGSQSRIQVKYQVAETPTWAAPVLLRNRILVKDKNSLIMWQFTDSKEN